MSAKSLVNAGQFLTFHLHGQVYGIPVQSVREINRVSEITPLPQTPEYVAGVMNLRGKVIPVLNLRKRLGFEPIAHTKTTCIIVVDGSHGQVGVIVDAVNTVIEFPEGQIEAAPQLNNSQSDYILGVGKSEKTIVILVDIISIVSQDSKLNEVAEQSSAA